MNDVEIQIYTAAYGAAYAWAYQNLTWDPPGGTGYAAKPHAERCGEYARGVAKSALDQYRNHPIYAHGGIG